MPATGQSGGLNRPGLPRLSLYLQRLTVVLALPYSAVRTPFTFILDAAEFVWVLGYPVTFRGHRQTGKRYHGDHECGNSYTPTPSVYTLQQCSRFLDSVRRCFARSVKSGLPSAPAQRSARTSVLSAAQPSVWSRSSAPRTAVIWNLDSAIQRLSSSGRSIATSRL